LRVCTRASAARSPHPSALRSRRGRRTVIACALGRLASVQPDVRADVHLDETRLVSRRRRQFSARYAPLAGPPPDACFKANPSKRTLARPPSAPSELVYGNNSGCKLSVDRAYLAAAEATGLLRVLLQHRVTDIARDKDHRYLVHVETVDGAHGPRLAAGAARRDRGRRRGRMALRPAAFAPPACRSRNQAPLWPLS
jgi:hypothetical protein